MRSGRIVVGLPSMGGMEKKRNMVQENCVAFVCATKLNHPVPLQQALFHISLNSKQFTTVDICPGIVKTILITKGNNGENKVVCKLRTSRADSPDPMFMAHPKHTRLKSPSVQPFSDLSNILPGNRSRTTARISPVSAMGAALLSASSNPSQWICLYCPRSRKLEPLESPDLILFNGGGESCSWCPDGITV